MVRTVLLDWLPLSEKPLGSYRKSRAKVKAFVQARQGSSRLPNKIYREIGGVPMLYHVINRVKQARLLDDVVICSPAPLPDVPDGISEFVYDKDESDVLSRYYNCLLKHPADYVVRITSDCPLIDPYLVDFIVHQAVAAKADYCSNVLAPTFPDGVDTEVISKNLLFYLQATATSEPHREHVTLAVRQSKAIRDKFSCISVEAKRDYSNVKWSVDTEEDLNRVGAILA